MTLRARLLLTSGAVVLASLVAVAIVTSRVVRVQFDSLVRSDMGAQPTEVTREVVGTITAHYSAHGWNGIGALLARLRDAHFRGLELALIAPNGRVIGVSSSPKDVLRSRRMPDGAVSIEYRSGSSFGRLLLRGGTPIVVPGGGTVASLLVLPPWTPPAAAAMHKVNLGLLAIVAAVSAAALVFTALLARRIVRPISDLEHAATRIAAGEFGHTVAPQSNDEVGRLARAFNAMSEQLQRNEVLRRNLMNDVAHELRTPLTDLFCAVEAVQDGLRQPDAALIGSLHDDLELLRRLVDDLQTLALAEAGKLQLRCEPCDLEALVARAVAADVIVDVPQGFVATVDPLRFTQILSNLVRNAQQHGGARVEVSAQARDGGGFTLAVRDDGAGIAAEHLPHIFDRFYRADPSRARTTGGAGLGLAIVRELVELHGAAISVASTPGAGTTFTIDFPKGPTTC